MKAARTIRGTVSGGLIAAALVIAIARTASADDRRIVQHHCSVHDAPQRSHPALNGGDDIPGLLAIGDVRREYDHLDASLP